MTNEERANKIKDMMAKRNITKAELQRRTKSRKHPKGIHRNTIGNVLSGKYSMDTETLQKIAAALGVSEKSLI